LATLRIVAIAQQILDDAINFGLAWSSLNLILPQGLFDRRWFRNPIGSAFVLDYNHYDSVG
jgi:hypothetical protein